MLVENMDWMEFREKARKTHTAIIPIGPIEEHGPQLPVGTDFFSPFEIAKLVGEKIPCFVLPAIPLGMCNSTANFPGTLSVSAKAIQIVVEDLCESLLKDKITKILVLSGHWGTRHTKAIDLAIARIKKKHPRAKLSRLLLFEKAIKSLGPELIETPGDDHAGEFETSVMLFLKENLVKMDRAVQDKAPIKDDKTIVNPLKYWKTGVDGNATKATREKGKKIAEKEVELIVKELEK